MIKQVSVFLENTSGRLYEVSKTISQNNINLIGISIAETSDYGVLRIIVSQPQKAQKILKENDYIAKITEVTGFIIDDVPGAMSEAFKILNDNDLSIEYLYTLTKKSGKAILIIKSDDGAKTEKILTENNIKVLAEEELKEL